MANVQTSNEADILARVIAKVPTTPDWPEHRSLDAAIMTDRSIWPRNTAENLLPLLRRFI